MNKRTNRYTGLSLTNMNEMLYRKLKTLLGESKEYMMFMDWKT